MTSSNRTKWTGAVVGLIVLSALGAWVRTGMRRAGPAARAAQPTGEMKDMPGMGDVSSMPKAAAGMVQLSAAQIRQFGIMFGTAEVRRMTGEVRTTGVVTVDETRVVDVAPRFEGFVEELYADFTGRVVRRGESLLSIYSPEVFAAMQELIVATNVAREKSAVVPGAPSTGTDLVGAARQRLQLLGVSDVEMDAVMRSGQASRTVSVLAPTSGVVTDKRVVRGQAVSAGQTLFTITDLSTVWVNADVRESDAQAVRVGMRGTVEVAATPGLSLSGVVTHVQPVMRPETRTVTARISVSNTNARLKPGMFATVLLRTGGREALVVPTAAVMRTGEREVVFVDMGGGELMPHAVRTGSVSDEYTEILSGLSTGDRVVTSAQFLIDSETNLGEVMRSMLGQGGAAAKGMGDMPGMEVRRP